MKLTAELFSVLSWAAQQKADAEIAATLRRRNKAEVARLSDEALLTAVREARETASEFGISVPALRMRFVMLDVFRLPGFWKDGSFRQMLDADTGTPDSRFGDVCRVIELSAFRAGKAEQVWWR